MATSLAQSAFTIDLALIVKGMALILTLLYLVFAVRVWVQVRRLERWLTLLRGHGLGMWALAHLGLAFVGLGLVLLLW